MNKRLTQIVVILVVGLLTLSIFLTGKNSAHSTLELSPEVKLPNQSEWDFNIQSAIDFQLKNDSSETLKQLYSEKSVNDSAAWLKQVAGVWDSLGHGLFAGYYYEKLARASGSATDWYKAGFRYFNLVNRTNDSFARREIGNHALMALQKTVSLDPMNLKAKAELGVSYMELMPNGVSPMTGVGLLREVLQQDSTNVDALYYLAYLSMKSGQYDKAVERLTLLTRLQPEVPSYYEYLANAYRLSGDTDMAIKSIEKYAELDGSEAAKEKALMFTKQLTN
ncbi:tetratricopeptide repeat protein [bacterium]|nr:tetratricopeptide repeat protein [bacterium]